MKRLGERVRALREAKGWSGYALALAAGITPTQVKAIEDGVTANPTMRTLLALSGALGVGIGELVGPVLPIAPEDVDALAPLVSLEGAAAGHSHAAADLTVGRKETEALRAEIAEASRRVQDALNQFAEALRKAEPPDKPRPKSGAAHPRVRVPK